jgi:hypothetical protein
MRDAPTAPASLVWTKPGTQGLKRTVISSGDESAGPDTRLVFSMNGPPGPACVPEGHASATRAARAIRLARAAYLMGSPLGWYARAAIVIQN